MMAIRTFRFALLVTAILSLGVTEISALEWDPVSGSLSADQDGNLIGSITSETSPGGEEETLLAALTASFRRVTNSPEDALESDHAEESPARRSDALELAVGSADLDSRTDDDVKYVTFGYRRYLRPIPSNDALRAFAGLGFGYYDASSDQWGSYLKVGFDVGLNKRACSDDPDPCCKSKKPHFKLELGGSHHQLEDDDNFFQGLVGLRIHVPSKPPDNCGKNRPAGQRSSARRAR